MYLQQLRDTLEEYRHAEIDHMTLQACQQDIWASLRALGPEVEQAVVDAIRHQEQAVASDYKLLSMWRLPEASGARRKDRLAVSQELFRITTTQDARGDRILHVARTELFTSNRATAAFIYDLAAELERRSDAAATWIIYPDPPNERIEIILRTRSDIELLERLLDRLLSCRRNTR